MRHLDVLHPEEVSASAAIACSDAKTPRKGIAKSRDPEIDVSAAREPEPVLLNRPEV
jgi:hypothetical protein